MLFVVSNSRDLMESKPCKEAKRAKLREALVVESHWDDTAKRRVADKVEFRSPKVWVVEGDILEFVQKHGRCVVTPPHDGSGDRDYDDLGYFDPPMWQVDIYGTHEPLL